MPLIKTLPSPGTSLAAWPLGRLASTGRFWPCACFQWRALPRACVGWCSCVSVVAAPFSLLVSRLLVRSQVFVQSAASPQLVLFARQPSRFPHRFCPATSEPASKPASQIDRPAARLAALACLQARRSLANRRGSARVAAMICVRSLLLLANSSDCSGPPSTSTLTTTTGARDGHLQRAPAYGRDNSISGCRVKNFRRPIASPGRH